MGFILELLAESFLPVPDLGKRKRERQRRELGDKHEFPVLSRNERLSTWVTGVSYVERGRIAFRAPPMSTEFSDVTGVATDGDGPASFGPTTLLRIVTASGRTEVFAVLSEYAARIVALLVPHNDS